MRAGPFVLALIAAVAACEDDLPPVTRPDAGAPAGPRVGPPAPPNTTRFVALGDTGKGTTGQRAVAQGIAQKCATSGCDFAILLGDNIYENGIASPEDPLMQTLFEDFYAGIDLEFQVALGNHDYGANGLGTEFGKAANEVAYTQRSRKWKLPAPHYTFQKPSVDFFVLDTNLMMFGRDADQRTAVSTWLASSQSPWRIAVGHHPYLSNGPHGNAGAYDGLGPTDQYAGVGVKSFLETIVCGRVDLYISAHDHSLQWHKSTCRNTTLALSGSGAQPTKLGGRNPTAFESLELGFLYVTLTPNALTAEFVDSAGRTLHTETLAK